MYIRVKVTPGAKREKLVVANDGRLEVSVREKAEGNRANERTIELVAAHYGVHIKAVRVVRGHHKKSKLLAIMK